LLLGRLPSNRPLAGGLRLDPSRAEAAFAELHAALGERAAASIQLAEGVLRIAVAKMAGAVREVSVHRGYDPRDFTLVGFGGAGPMHVLMVADELAIPRAVIPRFPGHLSALGQLLADHRRDDVLAWGGPLSALEVPALHRRVEQMRERASGALHADGVEDDRIRHEVTLDMRYRGQSFTLAVPWQEDYEKWDPLREAFNARHQETFGYADHENDTEIVNVRLMSTGLVDKPTLTFQPEQGNEAKLETRPVWFEGDWVDCPVFARAALPVGFTCLGPAILEEAGGTSVVPPGWVISVHASGALECVRE